MVSGCLGAAPSSDLEVPADEIEMAEASVESMQERERNEKDTRAELSRRGGGAVYVSANSNGRLVLGCINADFCKINTST